VTFDLEFLQYRDDDGTVVELRCQQRTCKWVDNDWSFEWPDTLKLESVISFKIRPPGKLPVFVYAEQHDKKLCFRGMNVDGREVEVSEEEAAGIIARPLRKYVGVFI
jgi:hypothetical protein